MYSLRLVSIQPSFFPGTGGEFRGFVQGIFRAGETRSRLSPFQRLIPQTTPKKHDLAADSMNSLNKGCYPVEKDIINCMKVSYTWQTVFPVVFSIALPFGLMHALIN